MSLLVFLWKGQHDGMEVNQWPESNDLGIDNHPLIETQKQSTEDKSCTNKAWFIECCNSDNYHETMELCACS